MNRAADITELRESLRKKFPSAHRMHPVEETPKAPVTDFKKPGKLDFDPGTVNEIVSTKSLQGMTLLISHLLDEERDLPLALIDGRDSFDPESYGNKRCNNLFWIRCTETDQIIKATDLLIRDGNLPLILLDLHLMPKREISRIPTNLWHRFRSEARESGSTLLVLSPHTIVPSAHSRYFIEGNFTLDHLEKLMPTFRVVPDTASRIHKPVLTS